MEKSNKELLIKDLCARLPYGVRARFCDGVKEEIDDVWDIDMFSGAINADYIVDDVKPYLRPMSSMTEEEVKEIRKINWQFWKPKNDSDECFVGDADDGYCSVSQMARIINYLNAHHFDYLGLIPMGLALEAPSDMYKTE